MQKKRKDSKTYDFYIALALLIAILIVIGVKLFSKTTDLQLGPAALKSSPTVYSSPSTTPSPSDSEASCEWSRNMQGRGLAWGHYQPVSYKNPVNPVEASYPRSACPNRDPPTWNSNCCTAYCSENIRAKAVENCREILDVEPFSCTSPCTFFLIMSEQCTIFESQSSINGYYLSHDEKSVYCGCLGEAVALGVAEYGCSKKLATF